MRIETKEVESSKGKGQSSIWMGEIATRRLSRLKSQDTCEHGRQYESRDKRDKEQQAIGPTSELSRTKDGKLLVSQLGD